MSGKWRYRKTWAILYGLLSRSPIMKSYFLDMMSPATRMSGERPSVLMSSSRTGGWQNNLRLLFVNSPYTHIVYEDIGTGLKWQQRFLLYRCVDQGLTWNGTVMNIYNSDAGMTRLYSPFNGNYSLLTCQCALQEGMWAINVKCNVKILDIGRLFIIWCDTHTSIYWIMNIEM